MSNVALHLGDCIVVLKTYPDNYFDSCVVDPPYLLSFMGKDFDKQHKALDGENDGQRMQAWHYKWAKEVIRVLKPGAHLLAFGGTRTSHRMVCAIEDAGFEIRDSIRYMGQDVYPAWVYASGFPKSQNIGKVIDSIAGAEREIVGIAYAGIGRQCRNGGEIVGGISDNRKKFIPVTVPSTDAAKQWGGWGTNLAPSWEPICLARKPIATATIAENVLQYGTGGLNIDACRIESPGASLARNNAQGDNGWKNSSGGKNAAAVREEQGLPAQGRWPKNTLIDDSPEIMAEFAKYGSKKAGGSRTGNEPSDKTKNTYGDYGKCSFASHADTGTAARFFYSAKASQAERHENGENNHPTVKNLSLMEYLCKLVTPPGGIVLDCFLGSGTTGVAARRNRFRFVGIEIAPEYYDIAVKRINDADRIGDGKPKQLIGHPDDFTDMPLFVPEMA